MFKIWKTYTVFAFFSVLAGLIVFRLYTLQIRDGEYYEVLALGQQVSFEESSAARGEIFFDNNGLALAQLIKKNFVYVFPNKIPASSLEKTAERLSDILLKEKEEIISLLREGDALKREVEEAVYLSLKEEGLEGVVLNQILSRFYPHNTLACHLAGFVNQEGEGQYGLEGFYDELLKGEGAIQEKGKSRFGYLTDTFKTTFSEQGPSLGLTVNDKLQYFSEKLLIEAGEQWQIESGQIIIEEPETGKILAMANWPVYNPNQYSEQADMGIFLNASTQKLFEPGSVLKVMTMAAGLEEGLITPETIYNDKGMVEVGGPAIYNFEKRVWGEQTMTDVLEHSINTGAVFVQRELGQKLFLKYLEEFGFFKETKIDLQGEVFSLNETLKSGYPRDFAVASFGQGIEVTTAQLVRAFGAIANGGKLMRPYLVSKIVLENGEQQVIESQEQGEVISRETANKLTLMLISVVENGSAMSAKIPGYYIAAKTGTAQIPNPKGGYYKDKSIQTVIGYFPALNPKFLIYVKLDSPCGSRSSALSSVPIFKQLTQQIIDLYQIPPDY